MDLFEPSTLKRVSYLYCRDVSSARRQSYEVSKLLFFMLAMRSSQESSSDFSKARISIVTIISHHS